MKLLISDSRKIYSIQKSFSQIFPFLKIEFYAKPQTNGGAPSRKLVEHSSKTLGECRIIHKKGTISITPQMSVTELEENFRDVYGLSIAIFRKSGNAWLDTSVTFGWSLEKQNAQGKILSEDSNASKQSSRGMESGKKLFLL